ncbi:MAG: peptidylprolyl isomerase [Fimbriimonadaceae bacterium]|nr:peptidylprolyl isomerase [Fimbriimonadaceae bacterium]
MQNTLFHALSLAAAIGLVGFMTIGEAEAQKLSKTAAPGATAPKAGEEIAVIETNLGRIVLKFFPGKAPNHVKNFKDLARKKFYDGTKFHRVIPNFMIQGGDPNSKGDDRSRYGTGDAGYKLKAEFNDTKHTRGILSMARAQDPDSAGSQFFIMVKEATHLDGQYTAFGQVIEGMDVVDKIVNLPRDARDCPLEANPAQVKSVKVAKWPLK